MQLRIVWPVPEPASHLKQGVGRCHTAVEHAADQSVERHAAGKLVAADEQGALIQGKIVLDVVLETPVGGLGIDEADAQPAGQDESADTRIELLPRLSIRLPVALVLLDEGPMEPFDSRIVLGMETDALLHGTDVIVDAVGNLPLDLREAGHVDQH